MAAGLRVQHEDKVMLVPFFLPVANKTGLVVSQEVFQLIDYTATCKLNQDFEKHARARNTPGNVTSSSAAKQWCCRETCWTRQQCARRLLLAAGLPDFYWSYAGTYAMRFAAEMLLLLVRLVQPGHSRQSRRHHLWL